MKSIKTLTTVNMPVVKVYESKPINWFVQNVTIRFANGIIHITHTFYSERYSNIKPIRIEHSYKGTKEEAKAYGRLLRWC